MSAQGSRNENPGVRSPEMDQTLKGLGGWRTLSGLKRFLM